jgi:tRNA A37 threonylcarbamoyladenosine biosynthesis protein TsaE
MKIYIPEPAIEENEGFSEKADIFQRKPFGERLANLVRSCKDGIVIALDAQWGEGKSTFIKMWRGHIGQDPEKPIKSLYFDAFANDYQKDPFLALAGELYELVTDEKEEKKKEFKDKAKGVAKSLARGAVKIAVRTISGGIVDGSMIDSAEKDVSELFADQVDSIIADKLENAKKDKLAIENFRGYLEEFAHNHGNGSPIVFIIDELDRCRPDFALDLLEQIKHLFSVKGIVFLLVLNRDALEEIIRVRYGSGVNAIQYLQKFINLWLTLPRKFDYYHQGWQYNDYLLKQMLEEQEPYYDEGANKVLNDLSGLKRLSCRHIERIFSYLAIIHNMGLFRNLDSNYKKIVVFVCYLKVSNPEIIERIILKNIEGKELFDLVDVVLKADDRSYPDVYHLKRLVEYDLSDNMTKEKMRMSNAQLQDLQSNMLQKACEWLSTISR